MIRRVLVAPLNASHRQRGQVEAFEKYFGKDNVFELDWVALDKNGLNAGEQIYLAARDMDVDWVWLQLQGAEAVAPMWLEKLRQERPNVIVTHWMGDCRSTVSDPLAAICRATDATLISNDGQHEMFRAAGAARTHYVQIGLDPEDIPSLCEDRWEPAFRVPDVVFIGNYYGHVEGFRAGTEARLEALATLVREGIDVGVVGAGWPTVAGGVRIPIVGTCHVKQSMQVYRRAKVALSISHFNDIRHYYSDRLLIAMASGTPVVAHAWPGWEEEFGIRNETGIHSDILNVYQGPTDLVATTKYLLRSERGFGKRAQLHVVKWHTWHQRIGELVPHVRRWRAEEIERRTR